MDVVQTQATGHNGDVVAYIMEIHPFLLMKSVN